MFTRAGSKTGSSFRSNPSKKAVKHKLCSREISEYNVELQKLKEVEVRTLEQYNRILELEEAINKGYEYRIKER